jgi:hypothetical protein
MPEGNTMSEETTYFVEIVRDSLDGYTNRVRNEEAGASSFVDNRVASLDGHMVNLATFEELAPGEVPDEPTFVKLGAVPGGAQAAWTGVLLIAGRNTAVQMFRQSEGGGT